MDPYVTIDEFSDVETEVIADDSYYSHYICLGDLGEHQIEIDLDSIISESVFSCSIGSVDILLEEFVSKIEDEQMTFELFVCLAQKLGHQECLELLCRAEDEVEEDE